MRFSGMIGCLALLLAGCTSQRANLPAGAAAYQIIPAPQDVNEPGEYRIGSMDELNVRVVNEEDLSLEKVPVDPNGNLSVGLIGEVKAAGRTAPDLAREIQSRLGERFLVNPSVSVNVMRSVSQRVTVDGQVKKPGNFEILGQTTLLQAIAEAQGASDIADLGEVYVFRRKDGQRYGAKFDVAAIRLGAAEDPRLIGGDVVIVGGSGLRGIYRDFLQAAPFLGTVFIALIQN